MKKFGNPNNNLLFKIWHQKINKIKSNLINNSAFFSCIKTTLPTSPFNYWLPYLIMSFFSFHNLIYIFSHETLKDIVSQKVEVLKEFAEESAVRIVKIYFFSKLFICKYLLFWIKIIYLILVKCAVINSDDNWNEH